MNLTVSEHLVRKLQELSDAPLLAEQADHALATTVTDDDLISLLDAQITSRHLDLIARDLQQRGEGFYTIGSAGHESDAVVALATRPTDPALLHYRSGAFYCARAAQVPGIDPTRDLLLSFMAAADDPISGGRHKVLGRAELSIIPQTSTIASHLPRAMGMAFALGRGLVRQDPTGGQAAYPEDAIVIAGIGDASVNHSTAVGALNGIAQSTHQGVPVPLLIVCEDNGLGISVRTPPGWTERTLSSWPGIDYLRASGEDPERALAVARRAVEIVRTRRHPVILHLDVVRFLGHAGSDAEIAYRSAREIVADYERDPILAVARALIRRGVMTAAGVLARYEATEASVAAMAEHLLPVRRLGTASEVCAPLAFTEKSHWSARILEDADARDQLGGDAGESTRDLAYRGKLPEGQGPLTLAQTVNATLTDLLLTHPAAVVFGEDVGVKGGVYGVTRGLRRAFGATRVFDTLLDEQAVLGTALGLALTGALPIPEIQYLAYLHNAEDQLRGEAATLRFFSAGQYGNGMIVRIAGLAYQRGFGGHFHNDNSLAVLLDIPGIVVAVPSGAAEASGLLRALAGLALADSRVCVFVEPIALYHTRDLHPGDGAWLAPYAPLDAEPAEQDSDDSSESGATPPNGRGCAALARGRVHGDGADVLMVTFGNGVAMSLRVAARVAADGGPRATVFDLRWLAPLPVDHLMAVAADFPRVLVVDETRRSGGVSTEVVAVLLDAGYTGRIHRVTSQDSVIPLGPAAETVLLGEEDIGQALWHGVPVLEEQR
ncbi:thiamine pyrophosphate-dependent enzyme [Austwickia chelonae]|uniref:thiamine pyrophosphate-dependent enzyme n=1 Tax=Austwickia chelonae TaxID=100225 RepID=UPI000E265893|nr:thiamine pyrophosphate-dependent enzyme [Austwickia chelonae]